jgi:3,4-dihydroxy-2-butanone 4-phosphate synthase
MTSPLKPVAISPLADIVADMKAGRMVILVDEEDRENEGDLVLAADHVTAEAINFMARFGRGLICLTLTRERCEHLKLPPMVERNGTVYSTAFTVSIEAAQGVTTGGHRVFSLAGRALFIHGDRQTHRQRVQPALHVPVFPRVESPGLGYSYLRAGGASGPARHLGDP